MFVYMSAFQIFVQETRSSDARMPESMPATPPLGHPVPNVHHAISVQLPTWDDIKEMFTGAPRVKDVQRTGYPRSFVHDDIKKV